MGKFVLAAILLQNIFCSVFFCSSLETTPERLDISVTSGLIEKQEQMVEKRLGICKCSYESIRKGGEKHKNSSIDWLQYGRYTHRHTIRKAPTRVILSAAKNLSEPF